MGWGWAMEAWYVVGVSKCWGWDVRTVLVDARVQSALRCSVTHFAHASRDGGRHISPRPLPSPTLPKASIQNACSEQQVAAQPPGKRNQITFAALHVLRIIQVCPPYCVS